MKLKISTIILLLLYAVVLGLNVVIWFSKSFCNWCIKTVFTFGINTYSRFTSLFSFSVGEVMIIIGISLIITLIAILIISLFRKTDGMKKLRRIYIKTFAWILLCVCYIMTFNCSALYHSSTFAEDYIPVSSRDTDSLIKLREYIVTNANELASTMERDSDGNLVYSGDLINDSIKSMKNLGNDYPMLSGYYPNPKKLAFSGFASQQYLAGVYFPFSFEANFNGEMYISNLGPTVCHELSHLKGFLQEDEANFIAYLACEKSDNDFLRYCGYISVYNYVNNDCHNSISSDNEYFSTMTKTNDLFNSDNIFLTPDAWKKVEDNAVFSTELVDEVSDNLTDTSLQLNGVSDGMKSYSRVVQLLLDYYSNSL